MNHSQLHEQKIVVFGGGSAGIGISHHLVGAMKAAGISEEKARQTIYVLDIHGLVYEGLPDIPPHQRPFARSKKEIEKWKVSGRITLSDVVSHVHPTVLIGVSAQPGVFTEEIVTTMSRYVERPIIFPLSNPTSKCEAHPADLMNWTQGKAIIATGSPFENVSQCNNVYIFPGVGLGVIACKAREVSETMFFKAAEVLSLHSPMLSTPQGALFPSFDKLRTISREIAIAVIKIAQHEGLAQKTDDPKTLIDATIWSPHYV